MSNIAKLLADSTEVGQLASDLAVLARMAGVSSGGIINGRKALLYALSPSTLIRHGARCLISGIALPGDEIRALNDQAQDLRTSLQAEFLETALEINLDAATCKGTLLEELLECHYRLEAIRQRRSDDYVA